MCFRITSGIADKSNTSIIYFTIFYVLLLGNWKVLFKQEKMQAVFLMIVEIIYYVPIYTAVETPVTGIFEAVGMAV